MKKFYYLRYLFYLLVISLVSTYLILLTYGYKIDLTNYKIEKTSIIYIASIPQDANVYIDNKFVANTTPLKYTNILSGTYDVLLEHPLYETWQKTFYVKNDYVSQDPDVILILKNKPKIDLEDKEIKEFEDFFENENTQKESRVGLFVKNGSEIYFEDIFVTRLSKDIKNIAWFADKKHLLYQIEDKIYFSDSDGTNNIVLVQLPGEDVAKFISWNDGKYLVYQYQDGIKKIQITNIESLFKEKYFNKAVKIIK